PCHQSYFEDANFPRGHGLLSAERGMNMSRYFLSFAALALISTGGASVQQSSDPGAAQGATQQEAGRRGAYGRGGSQRQHMAMLARKLNLNDAQRQQFFAIGQRTREQAMTIRSDSSLNSDQKQEKLKALRKQSHQEMFAVLTPEQKEQLKQMREQMQKE